MYSRLIGTVESLNTFPYQNEKVREKYENDFEYFALLYQDQDNYNLLNNLYKKLKALEEVILKNEAEKKKQIPPKKDLKQFAKEDNELKKTKEKLEQENIAMWKMYASSLDLAISLVSSDVSLTQKAQKLSDKAKNQITLLSESLDFATLVISKKDKLNDEDLRKGTKIAEDIQKLSLTSLEKEKYDKKQKWLNVAIAFGAVLFIAAIVALAVGLSFGAAAPVIAVVGVALYLALALPGGVIMGFSAGSKKDLADKASQPKKDFQRFYQSTVKHGKDKQVIPEDVLNPPPSKKGKK